MKKYFFIFISLSLFGCLASETDRMEYMEEKVCKCIDGAAEEMGIDVDSEVKEYHQFLVNEKILKDESAAELENLFVRLGSENEIIQIPYRKSRLEDLVMNNDFQKCVENFMNDEYLDHTKHRTFSNYMKNSEPLTGDDMQEFKNASKKFAEVYRKEDFERPYMKMMSLIMILSYTETLIEINTSIP